MYKKLKRALKLAYKGDDLIVQEDLFELQEQLAVLALEAAKKEKMTNDLIKVFPYLYKKEAK